MKFRAALAMLVMAPAISLAAPPPPAAQAEITHLLDYIVASGCDFQRNGGWHKPAEARAHLQKKLDYFVGKDQIATAEDFIGKAASASSMSGKAYQVKCGIAEPQPSAEFLTAELKRYRTPTDRKP